MFAVTGITGKVGAAVARGLLSADQSVRAVVRDRGRGTPWAELGCDIAVADVSDTEALSAAFEGTTGVFALLPPVFDPTPGFPEAIGFINSLHAALARAKPARVVALSTVGADAPQPNLLNVLGRMEQVLGTLPMPVTFLRAAWFMENAAWDVASAKSGLIRSYLQPLDRAFPMVSTDDVGSTAAALLQERWEGKRVVELEAPQRVSPNALAAGFATVLGTPVRAEVVPRGQWESVFRAQGMKNPTPRMQMIDGFNAGWIDFEDRGAHARKGYINIDRAIATLLQRQMGS
ncbi:MAG TPA: NmrA family NAD(P)-binding protein [Steroidobacteraceae bacterium]|jgi:NAD(P)H dehydrogenase (quinone)|nr:NmrA family NAD(P)-binding protein [Steroidobacteraceae bacterium]